MLSYSFMKALDRQSELCCIIAASIENHFIIKDIGLLFCVMLLPPDGHSGYVTLSGQHPEARGHLSEALTEDTGVGNSVAGSPLPLTTGNENLDVAIVIHLQYCNHLIKVELLMTSNIMLWSINRLIL